MLNKKIAIDFGQRTMRLMVHGEALRIGEPSNVAMRDNGRGKAKVRLGRSIDGIQEERGGYTFHSVMEAGHIKNTDALHGAVRALITRGIGHQRFFRPDIIFPVLPELGHDERIELLHAAMVAGVRTAYLLDIPVAAALGSEANHTAITPRRCVVVIRDDLTVIAVTSGCDIIESQTLSYGVEDLVVTACEEAKATRKEPIATREMESLLRYGIDKANEKGRLSIESNGYEKSFIRDLTELAREYVRKIAVEIDAFVTGICGVMTGDNTCTVTVAGEGTWIWSRFSSAISIGGMVTPVLSPDPEWTLSKGALTAFDSHPLISRGYGR